MEPEHLEVVDSHTGGEPTRVVVSGGPDLGQGPLDERVRRLRSEFDHLRTRTVSEPRGSDAWVGALLCEPHAADCDVGVIFFNNVDYLGMCGHGTIGLVETLAHLGRIEPGPVRIDTPVGAVTAHWNDDGSVTLRNVPSWRHAAGVELDVPGLGRVRGDVAYGGNWFFLTETPPPCEITIANEPQLNAACRAIRSAIEKAGITGEDGGMIDHIEFFGPPREVANDSRNYVLCPGGAYDRSPCGTGTSAKLSCLAADGRLAPGETWRQESVIGSVFAASYEHAEEPGKIVPTLVGRANVSAVSRLVFDPRDPFPNGIPT